MELVEKEIKYKRSTVPVTLTAVGDLHVGNAGFDEDYFLEQRKEILKRNAHTILVGDLMDSILISDKRYESGCLDQRFATPQKLDCLIDECYYHTLDLLKPIRHLILGCVEGNHEETLRKRTQTDVTKRLSMELGVPYLHGGGYISMVLRRGKATRQRGIYAAHGSGGASTYGSKINKLLGMRDIMEADFYVCGHMHDRLTKVIPRLGCKKSINGLGLTNRPMAFMATGAYLQTYREGVSGYGERKMYKPVTMGCAFFQLYPEEGKVKICG